MYGNEEKVKRLTEALGDPSLALGNISRVTFIAPHGRLCQHTQSDNDERNRIGCSVARDS